MPLTHTSVTVPITSWPGVHPVETGDEVEKGASSEMQDDV
ncbi:MAG: hypothetical protein JWP70_121, partial [Leifsonia sp.]|nr:hypothetical protein [Leifsonia sp.]